MSESISMKFARIVRYEDMIADRAVIRELQEDECHGRDLENVTITFGEKLMVLAGREINYVCIYGERKYEVQKLHEMGLSDKQIDKYLPRIEGDTRIRPKEYIYVPLIGSKSNKAITMYISSPFTIIKDGQ
jgi:hypothetical protein